MCPALVASFVITLARWLQEGGGVPPLSTTLLLGNAETPRALIAFVAFIVYLISALLGVDERSNILFKYNVPERVIFFIFKLYTVYACVRACMGILGCPYFLSDIRPFA